MSSPHAKPDLAPCLERCFLFDAVESSYAVTGIQGRLPSWLRGSYYVNGPARFQRGDLRYRHWLDGDGMVCALHFDADGVRFVNRFVRTAKLIDEDVADRPVYRGFGTSFPGDRLRRNLMLEPPANVSVYPFANVLLAFGEQTLPYRMDARTLDTLGQFDAEGHFNDVTPFAAHPKFDSASGSLVNFGISYSATNPLVNVYECNTAGSLTSRRRFALSHPYSFHDFGITPNHVVFFASPLLMDFGRFLRDGLSVLESLLWNPDLGAKILVRPRTGNGISCDVTVHVGYCLHFINCFESNGRLAVDVIELDGPIYPEYQPIPDLFATAPAGRPVRYWIDFAERRVVERIALPYDRTPDLPSIDPSLYSQTYNDFWMVGISASGLAGRKFFDQLTRASWQVGDAVETYRLPIGEYFAGEPLFIGNPANHDEAVVILQHLKPRDAAVDFVVFDAYHVAAGPLAGLPLRYPIHPGFHSSFLPRW